MNSPALQENTCFGVDQPPSRVQRKPSAAPPSLCPVATKAVLMDFDGGRLSSDAGLLLLKEVDQRLGLTRRLSEVLSDPRDRRYTKHTMEEMLRQRVFQIAAGYEDANDSDSLRHDPVVKMVVGRLPEQGAPLASQPTISRTERLPETAASYARCTRRFSSALRALALALGLVYAHNL